MLHPGSAPKRNASPLGATFFTHSGRSIFEDVHPAHPQQILKILAKHKIMLREFSSAHIVIDVTEHQTYPANFLPLAIMMIKSQDNTLSRRTGSINSGQLSFVLKALPRYGILIKLNSLNLCQNHFLFKLVYGTN